MSKLRLSEWANIAEIIASIVIVASLAYIGIELNQNTQALQQDSYQATVATLVELDIAEATNADLSRIMVEGNSSPRALTPEEWARFVRLAYSRIGLWEYVYLSSREKAISGTQLIALEPYFIQLVCSVGLKQFWAENKVGFSPEFVAYYEMEARSTCGDIYD